VWPSLDDAALRLGDEDSTYGELLVVGTAIGLLDATRDGTSRAIGLLSADASAIDERELRQTAEAFRRQRKLHSGDDLRTWLARRQLDEAEWTGYLRRSVALNSSLDSGAPIEASAELEHALVVDLACSGWWGRVADELVRLWSAGRVPAQDGVPGEPSAQVAANGDRSDGSLEPKAKRIAEGLPILGVLDVGWCADRLRLLESRRRALADVVATCSVRGVVERRIAEHAFDWTAFIYDEIRLPSRASANEAIICAREDGLLAAEVAARARVELVRRELRRDQISTGMAAMLTGAIPGDVLGPFDEDDGMHVVWLQGRRAPSVDDPTTREAAVAELVSDRLDRAAAGRMLVVGPL
jgi:hypothetical protein